MSGTQKKGFAAFLRPVGQPETAPPIAPEQAEEGREVDAAPQASLGRARQLTSTGRVRTHSANRQLPGVTLRLAEDRWERLKMLSIQERRPIQDILGEAMDAYMKARGLPW
jgi:hypothetical protein